MFTFNYLTIFMIYETVSCVLLYKMSPGVLQKVDNNCITNWYIFLSYVPVIAFIEKKYPKSDHI